MLINMCDDMSIIAHVDCLCLCVFECMSEWLWLNVNRSNLIEANFVQVPTCNKNQNSCIKYHGNVLKPLKPCKESNFIRRSLMRQIQPGGTLLNVKQEEEMITCELAIHNLSSILYL